MKHQKYFFEARNLILSKFTAASAPLTGDSDSVDVWKWFENYILKLSKKGWKRKDIHDLIDDIFKSNQLDENILDELYEFETALIGNCAPECIIRLEGDPEDISDLTAYVRSGKWKDDPGYFAQAEAA
jgi:hypothetical protein